MPQLEKGQEVFIPDRKQFGRVEGKYQDHDRSYVVKTDSGLYRRNSVQLNRMPPKPSATDDPPAMERPTSVPATVKESVCADSSPTVQDGEVKVNRSRSGRVIVKPRRLEDCVLK